MRPSCLVDTGALLSLLDREDEWHERCVKAYESVRLPLAPTSAVLAELFHVLAPHEHPAAWRLLRSRALTALPISDADFPEFDSLMEKYRDRPMDFADATLVRLARREHLATVLTVDDDFLVYRIEGRRRFLVLPER